MEALNAVGLTPLSVLSQKRTEQQQKKNNLSFSTTISPQFNKKESLNLQEGLFSRTFNGSLAILSSLMSSGLAAAKALTYEEALAQSMTTPEFDTEGVLDGISNFVGENPLIIGGGIAILAVPLIVSQLFFGGGGKKKTWGIESAKTAYAKLGDDGGAQLLDIRPLSELRQVGSPDIRGLKKNKAVNVPYNGEDKNGFLKKVSLKFKEPENTTLFVLDKFDGNSELVAELVTANGFKAAYAIKDGAEGTRGWVNSGLPWILPKKLSFDLSSFTDTIGGAIGEGADAASVALALAAATGLGLFSFTEVETILQLLGSVALIQFFSKKLLFAEDRKQTLQEVDEFLTTKVAPKELVDDIKQIGKALLPTTVSSKALSAPAAESSPASTVSKAESVTPVNDAPAKEEAVVEPKPELVTPVKAEAVAEPKPEINSVPKAEVQKESLPEVPRSQSPYPNYPDFKPPASPMPSQP